MGSDEVVYSVQNRYPYVLCYLFSEFSNDYITASYSVLFPLLSNPDGVVIDRRGAGRSQGFYWQFSYSVRGIREPLILMRSISSVQEPIRCQ
jgi:hypothetical protein